MDLNAHATASRLMAENVFVSATAVSFRVWELFALTLVLQIGMLPLMARDFHRITVAAPAVNLFAVRLTGIVVPLGFLTLATGLIFLHWEKSSQCSLAD
jgi:Competence protein